MKTPHFRSLAEQFYLGRIAIENDMSVDSIERFLDTLGADGLKRYVNGSIIHVKRTKDPDVIETGHCYRTDMPVQKLSDVLKDSVNVSKIADMYDRLVNLLKKIENPIVRELAIRNIDLEFAFYYDFKTINAPSDALKSAFNWQRTEEGVTFWSSVNSLLENDGTLLSISEKIAETLRKLSEEKSTTYITHQEIAQKFNLEEGQFVVIL